MLTKIHEYKGKQELYIATTDEYLKQIMAEKIKLRNREEEIAGYRDVLKLIHASYEYIRVVPNDILTLHKNLYNYSAKSYKGKFKSCDNIITEKLWMVLNEFVLCSHQPI